LEASISGFQTRKRAVEASTNFRKMAEKLSITPNRIRIEINHSNIRRKVDRWGSGTELQLPSRWAPICRAIVHTSTSERSSSANAIVPPKAKANDQHLMMAFVAWRLSQPPVVIHFPAVATIAAAPYARPTRAAGSGGKRRAVILVRSSQLLA